MEGNISAAPSRMVELAAAALIGGAPVWMVLIVWDFTDQRAGWQIFIRGNSFVIPLIELAFVLIAMAIGFSSRRAIVNLPGLTKIATLLWLPIVAVTSFQASNDLLGATIGLAKLFCATLFMLALVELRRAGHDRLFAVIWVGVGLGVACYLPIWMLFIAITKPAGNEWITLAPGVNNVRHIGHFAFAGYFAAVACLILFRDHARFAWRWAAPVLLASLSLGMILWPGSRGPTLAAILGMILVILLGAGFRRQLCLFFISSAFISTAVVATLPVPHPIFGIVESTGIADVQAGSDHDASSGRTELWRETIKKIEDKPLFGWGVEQYSALGPTFLHGTRHPHNFPLQILFSGGIISTLLAALIIFPALRRWRWPYHDGIGLAGTGCVSGIIVYSMYDGTLFFSYPIMLCILAIATSVNPAAQRHDPDR